MVKHVFTDNRHHVVVCRLVVGCCDWISSKEWLFKKNETTWSHVSVLSRSSISFVLPDSTPTLCWVSRAVERDRPGQPHPHSQHEALLSSPLTGFTANRTYHWTNERTNDSERFFLPNWIKEKNHEIHRMITMISAYLAERQGRGRQQGPAAWLLSRTASCGALRESSLQGQHLMVSTQAQCESWLFISYSYRPRNNDNGIEAWLLERNCVGFRYIFSCCLIASSELESFEWARMWTICRRVGGTCRLNASKNIFCWRSYCWIKHLNVTLFIPLLLS